MSVSGNLREPALAKRHRIGQAFEWLCCGSTWFGMVVLLLLLLSVALAAGVTPVGLVAVAGVEQLQPAPTTGADVQQPAPTAGQHIRLL